MEDTVGEDMGTVEHIVLVEEIIGMIWRVAVICHVAYRSSSSTGQSSFVCVCTKWCTKFVLIDGPCRKLVEGLVAHLDQKHFEEVWPLRHYSTDAFKRKVLKIFEDPDLTQATSRELL